MTTPAPHVISLPHTSNPGVIVGGDVARCEGCQYWTAKQHAAQMAQDWDAGAVARGGMHGHWEATHRV
ncbi:hypothetical protein ACQEVX_30245 [Streptomyces syringium]|uniref:hypothetical protein n=1 Tax=Streptomyces syringium TaxID=76729 RepID=UPI003D8D45C1